jgi:Zn ribbon nucleic-acid-binding protein
VPNTDNPLPIACPKCHHNGSMLIVQSLTVIMVKCADCLHTWAADLDGLPSEIQEKVRGVLQDDQQNAHIRMRPQRNNQT